MVPCIVSSSLKDGIGDVSIVPCIVSSFLKNESRSPEDSFFLYKTC